jgi:hypothetical protein
MVEQILLNNERCYSNFSPTFHEVNTPQLLKFTVQIECNLYNKVWQPFLRHNFSVATSAAWRAPVGNQTARKSHHII